MWSIINHTPYKADRAWGRDKDGVHEWIVAVKGTFDIKSDGRVELADEQLEPLLLAEYNGEPGPSSLRYDADIVSPKPTTDIVLNGTAYAPQGRPSEDFLVGMRIGRIQKHLRVRGNRWWEGGRIGLTPTAAEPITEIPIVYERAYGGFDQSNPDPSKQRLDTRNPVGCGIVAQEGQPLPNFEYSKGKLEETGPAGFGAIDSFWSPRRELCGTYDEAWQQSRFPLLPADWDPHSLLCSPVDQLPESYLRGGEVVELENLTPNSKLSFALPKVFFRFRTRIDNRTEEHRGWLATVIIEPDYPRVMMVWQSSLTVRTNADYLDETIVTEKALN